MRLKKQQGNQLPEINLVPMMDVLMTVLTFFIIVSMTLTGQQVMNVELPTAEGGTDPAAGVNGKKVSTLVVGLNPQKQIVMNNASVSEDELTAKMQDFLVQNPDGIVILKADKGLIYNDVAKVLETMRNIGGDRVSLGISGGN